MAMAAPSIQIVDCAARHLAYLPRHGTIYAVNAVAAATPVWTTASDRGLPRTGWLLGYFPEAPGDAIFSEPAPELQIGPEIEGPFDEDVLLRHGQTPAGRAAFTSFRGMHAEVETYHRAIRAWCADHGETFTGAIWERYAWNTDPAQQVIELYYLLT
jgi:effector-binding domain-containing protein